MPKFDFPNVAVVLYDDLPPDCDDIKSNLIDLTEFKLNGRYRLDIRITKDIDTTIDRIADLDYEWVAVVTAGNFLQDQSLILQTIDHAKKENSPLACHILDRGGYYHFHQQWFVMDLQTWVEIGRPRLSEHPGSVDIVTADTDRSPDNVHDDYTPWWVRPKSSDIKSYKSDYGYFGVHVISSLIRAGHSITNIPHDIRNRKNYCYPHHNHDRLVRVINKESFEIDDVALIWFKRALDELIDGLDRGYYVLNTENLNRDLRIQNRNYDRFIGVCGGIKPVCIAGQDNFSDDSQVMLFDISRAAIDYQKFLLERWDGDFAKFESVWREFQHIHPDYRPHYFSNHSIDTNISWFLDSAGISREEFTRLWQRYQKMQHEFIYLDLLSESAADRIVEMTHSSTGSYVWLSNAFNMDYLMFYKTRKWCDDYNRQFVDTLKNKTRSPITLENCGVLEFIG